MLALKSSSNNGGTGGEGRLLGGVQGATVEADEGTITCGRRLPNEPVCLVIQVTVVMGAASSDVVQRTISNTFDEGEVAAQRVRSAMLGASKDVALPRVSSKPASSAVTVVDKFIPSQGLRGHRGAAFCGGCGRV